jgi:hypothetical protein
MATTSACAVGSLVAVTRLKPSPTTRPSFTMTAPKGPPLRCTFSRDSWMARRMKACCASVVMDAFLARGPGGFVARCRERTPWRAMRRWIRTNGNASKHLTAFAHALH